MKHWSTVSKILTMSGALRMTRFLNGRPSVLQNYNNLEHDT